MTYSTSVLTLLVAGAEAFSPTMRVAPASAATAVAIRCAYPKMEAMSWGEFRTSQKGKGLNVNGMSEMWAQYKAAVAETAARVQAANENTTEVSAKQAWMAKLEAPQWGQAAAAVAQVASSAVATSELAEQCAQQVDEACEQLSSEEDAKRAWLERLDAPTWGAVAAAVTEVAMASQVSKSKDAAESPASEDAAKAAWLAKLDAPAWGKASSALVDIASDAAVETYWSEKCDEGEDEACEQLSAEEDAKRAWLAKLDASTWGAVNAAVTAVASEVSAQPGMTAEEIAKRAWLAARDDSAPPRSSGAAAQAAAAAAAATAAATPPAAAPPAASAATAADSADSKAAAKAAWLAARESPSWSRGDSTISWGTME